MPVTVSTTTTKPTGVAFFHESSAENLAINEAIHTWTMSQPGLNSHNVTSPNADTRIATLVFDTLENYTNWNSNRAQLADQLTRVAYNKAHNIISVVHETVT